MKTHELRPSFRWSDPEPTDRYTIVVRPDDKDGAAALKIVDVRGRSTIFPRDRLSLTPGRRYWVELHIDGEFSSRQLIETLAEADRLEVQADLETLRAMLRRGPSLLRAEYFRQRGLYGEAREELERLRVVDSGNICLLRLLKSVYRRLGLRDDEERALKLIRKRG